MGGVAEPTLILPGGESPGEAFKRVFDSYTKGNEISTDVESGTEIAKIATKMYQVTQQKQFIKQIRLIILVTIIKVQLYIMTNLLNKFLIQTTLKTKHIQVL